MSCLIGVVDSSQFLLRDVTSQVIGAFRTRDLRLKALLTIHPSLSSLVSSPGQVPRLYYVMVSCLALIGRSPPPTLPYRLYTSSLYAIMLRVQPGWLEIRRKSLRAWH